MACSGSWRRPPMATGVAARHAYRQWGHGLTGHCRPACAAARPRRRQRPAGLEHCSNPDEDQNTCDRRLPLVWRRCIHAATDTVVRRPHGRLPGDRLARLDHLARRRLAEEAPGHTAPKLRGAHARNSAQGVLMRRQTWRTPDVAAPPRPMVRNAPSGGPPPPAWRRGTKFFKHNYPDHEWRMGGPSVRSGWMSQSTFTKLRCGTVYM